MDSQRAVKSSCAGWPGTARAWAPPAERKESWAWVCRACQPRGGASPGEAQVWKAEEGGGGQARREGASSAQGHGADPLELQSSRPVVVFLSGVLGFIHICY